MRSHIILGRGRSIHKQDLGNALYYHQLSHKNGGRMAVKKNLGSGMVTHPRHYDNGLSNPVIGQGYKNKQFKPLKFKM